MTQVSFSRNPFTHRERIVLIEKHSESLINIDLDIEQNEGFHVRKMFSLSLETK
jgi:hypothetical protein